VTVSLPAYSLIPCRRGAEDVVVGPDGSYIRAAGRRVLAVAPEDGTVREVANTGGGL